MTKHRISDTEAAALLRGDATSVNPELAALASSLSDFRAAAFEQTPQPSAEVRARLDAKAATAKEAPAVAAAVVSDKKRVRQMLSWLTGLGVFAKIVLASTVASAAVVGAGAAGVLPDGPQNAFDTVVSTVVSNEEPESTPTGTPTPEPTETGEAGNFGGTVSELAHELGKGSDGYAFGKAISEAAKNNGNGGGNGHGSESESDDAEPEEETTSDDEPTVDAPTGGKPAGTPGGKRG